MREFLERVLTPEQRAEYGRILAHGRRRTARTCVHCGVEFEGLGRQQYCSDRCKQKAYRQRHRPHPDAPAAGGTNG
jgi:hypothetical protein